MAAHHHAVPARPIKPTRMDLAVVIALAEAYGTALSRDARFVPVFDFIADYGAVALVPRVMYGARIENKGSASGIAHENTRLAEVLRDARVALEFLCATWPDVFLAETHGLLAGLGVRVRPFDADPLLPTGPLDAAPARAEAYRGDENPGRDEGCEDEGRDEGEGGGHG
jgi:hypothetical protein